jgi:hypothetical protein
MGMYDYLFINTDKLPVSDEEKKIIGDNPGWQTKCLDCELTEVYITDDNELKVNKYELQPTPLEERPFPNGEGLKGLIGSLKRVNERLENIPYNGTINFYTNIQKEYWYEFNAKFIDGKLVEIVGGKQKY